ncbi:methylenetetrahydrofolate reductase [uncultured Agrococcus sp.]|uniref:methylenetetrahydrofolate reductase n=1 Tax=uncultured Agrococcus sp. TaxID=382258 RepID=UPI0025EAC60B|nr:methylenetetrahydrofolate reductase [uncultured Agrococcus sp.]
MSLKYSFELFPPRNEAAGERLKTTIETFSSIAPEFVSVTFGAGGSHSRASLSVLQQLVDARLDPMAHLTCVGLGVEEAGLLVRSFLDAGITKFLALRGDLPDDPREQRTELQSAAELVQLIEGVDTERVPYEHVPLPGLRAASIRERRQNVEIAVAAFPNGHPTSGARRNDVDALLAKQNSGATLAITQLFFDPYDYLEFVDMAAARGVTIPILPGIVIPTTLRRLQRSAELAGERIPASLAQQLDGASSEDGRRIGVDAAVAIIDELRDHDVPHIHLYTFNDHRPAFDTLTAVDAITPIGAQ